MDTVLTINGVDYTAAQRAAARIAINGMHVVGGGYSTLDFSEVGIGTPFPTWRDWLAVSLKTVSDGVTVYSGYIIGCQSGQSGEGWTHGYSTRDRRWAADKLVPVTATDGTGTAVYNRTPDDEYGTASDRGLTLGTIVQRVLTVPATATRLHALGLMNYTSLSPPTLPAATLADLALMTVVPPSPVAFQGKAIFSQVEQHASRWMPRFVQGVGQDGTLRFRDSTSTASYTPRTITLPSRFGSGDPVPRWPSVRRSSENVANRYTIRGGPKVEAYILSLLDGTLAEGFSSTDKSTWTYYDFIRPKGASDAGTVTSMTSTSATLQSGDNTVTWAANFWSGNQATVFLLNPVATGLSLIETRTVTSNAAMTAGSTAVVHWDSSLPTDSSSYTKYRITGTAGAGIDTFRLYYPREPQSGATGLATYVGAHMVRRSARPVHWANVSKSFDEFYTQAVVVGGNPLASLPLQVEPVPSLGGYRFVQPTVTVFGDLGKLKSGSPTTVADGLPSDVQILALYSRGALSAVYPADVSGVPQYGGTAGAAGIQIDEYLDFPTWLDAGGAPDMTTLANEHCVTTQDVVYEVTIEWSVGASGTLPAWSFLVPDYSLNVAVSGSTSPWSAINAPIRSVSVSWTAGPQSPSIQSISFSASTQRKPFTGDDLYVHPSFTFQSPLSGVGGMGGLLGSNVMPTFGRDATADAVAAGQSFGGDVVSDAAYRSDGMASGPSPQRRGHKQTPQEYFAKIKRDHERAVKLEEAQKNMRPDTDERDYYDGGE